MSRPEKQIFERLGPEGLRRVLDDVIEQKRLVRLANTCGLKYPGMRTQSQERPRIIADLVAKSSSQVAARKAIYRALQKETLAMSRKWNALSEDEKRRRLADPELLSKNGSLGLHVFLAAKDTGSEAADLDALLGMIQPEPASPPSKGTTAARSAKAASRDEVRLKKSVTQLQKKVRHLEGQLAKARESEKNAKRDLIRRKGELAESRMLAERLGQESRSAQRELQKVLADKPAAESESAALEKARKVLRDLSAEQTKLVHQLRKANKAPAAVQAPIEPLVAGFQEMKKEVEGLKRQRSRELTEQKKQLEEMRTELLGVRKAVTRPARPKRARGDAARVGVFVDVQNVYYAARRLKGKLDFDALMQAAVGDRRLIQATAYVVESKETDQTGFIAVLHQRGLEVRRKTLRVRADGSMKGDWDMELALDVLDMAKNLDVVVLVSGDGDFTSLVKRVKRMGPRVEVIGFPRHTAKALIEAADTFQPLDRKFMIYPSREKPSGPPRTQAAALGKTSAATAK